MAVSRSGPSAPTAAAAWLRRRPHLPLLTAASLLAVVLRRLGWSHLNSDLTGFLLPWYDHILASGGYRALGEAFSNYTPPYTYLLVAATYLHPWVPKVVAIKAISGGFDFLAAIVMYRLVRLRYPSGALPWLAYGAVLYAPTVIINSSVWGQCDIIYATFLLATVYFICRRRPLLAVICFAVAFSFKAQAIFLAPFMLVLFLKRLIPWRYMLAFPVVFLLLLLPAALAGRSLVDLLGVYPGQAGTYSMLCRNAPNLYCLIPDTYYAIAAPIGIAIAIQAALLLALAARRSRVALDEAKLLRAATLSVVLMPFLLPKMHDRYFFPADLLSIALAFYCPRSRALPFLLQITSLSSYMPFLFREQFLPLPLAGLLNLLVIVCLLHAHLRDLYPLPPSAANTSPGVTSGPQAAGLAGPGGSNRPAHA